METLGREINEMCILLAYNIHKYTYVQKYIRFVNYNELMSTKVFVKREKRNGEIAAAG